MRPDIEKAIKEFGGHAVMNKKNIETLENMLFPNETVLFATATNISITTHNSKKQQKLPGFIMMTDQRFLFSYKALLEHQVESISLRDVQSVSSMGNGLTGGHVKIESFTKSYDILVTYKKQNIQKIQMLFENARNSVLSPPKSNISSISVADEIKKFKELLDTGVITQEEFDLKKSQLLK